MVLSANITDLSGNQLEAVQIGVQKMLRRCDGKNTLPGQPRADLRGQHLLAYLRAAHIPIHLDRLSPHLWLVSANVPLQEGTAIDALPRYLNHTMGISRHFITKPLAVGE